MKKILTLIFVIVGLGFAQSKPNISFVDLMKAAEENPQIQYDAQQLAISKGEPIEIFLKEKIYIEAKGIEKGNIVYTIITDPLKIYNGAYTAFFPEINNKYNLSKAKINYGNGKIVNPLNLQEYKEPFSKYTGSEILLVVESSQKRVIALNPQNGNLISETFIPGDATNLSTPLHLLKLQNQQYIISDQIKDGVLRYDTSKVYQGFYAPAGGANTTILDNVRGMNYKIGTNNLLVTTAASSSPNSVREFDTGGNLVGDFIASNDNGLTSPFFILPRQSDYIVTASSGTNRILRYNSTGNFVNTIMTSSGTTFPEQIIELADGNFAFAEFSLPGSGIKIITPTGTLLKNFTGAEGLRGIFQLGTGNFVVSNGTGIHEIDSSNGAVVRTIVGGATGYSGRFMTKITLGSGNTSAMNFQNGWNLFSVPLLASDMSVTNLLPDKTSSVYAYNNGYQNMDTLKNGIGYWVKFGQNKVVSIQGQVAASKTTNVQQGWNIIGPYETDVPKNSITTNPPNNVGSLFYEFNTVQGYLTSDTLKVGKGYFVKFNQAGTVTVP